MFCAGRISSKKIFQSASKRGNRRRIVSFRCREGLVAVHGFHQAQFAQVARKRGLGHAHAQVDELAAQIVLTGDCFAREELQDLTLPEFFMSAHVMHFMHNSA